LGLPRSSWYYKPQEVASDDLELMRRIDEQYTLTPFYGIRRMTVSLHQQGHRVNHKRVQRLMRLMGIEAIYPKPRLSRRDEQHKVFPYLLRDLKIERPNQVWASDITYIRLRRGFVYLVAIMDWFSRYVLSWEVSITLDVSFCLAALEWALRTATPDIFNTDQGSQFTSESFTQMLLAHDIEISMDGRGRALDNIFVERLWRTVKYEEVYLKDYDDLSDAIESLRSFFLFYNRERIHQSLGYRTPEAVYFEKRNRSQTFTKTAMVMIGSS